MSFRPRFVLQLIVSFGVAFVLPMVLVSSAAAQDASAQSVGLRNAGFSSAKAAPQHSAGGGMQLVRASFGSPGAGFSESPSGISLQSGKGVLGGADAAVSDQDGDGVVDAADNCLVRANPNQVDSDGDGCGNVCDADFDQDGGVGGPDFTIFAFAFGKSQGEPGYIAAADCNGDQTIGGPDYTCFSFGYNSRFAGPSGRADRDQSVCQ